MPHVISGEETTWWKIRCSPLRWNNLEEERQNNIMQKRMGENSTGFIMLSNHMHLFFFSVFAEVRSQSYTSPFAVSCVCLGFLTEDTRDVVEHNRTYENTSLFVLCWYFPLISQWFSLQKSVAHRIGFEGASGTALVCQTQGYWNNSTKTWHIIRLHRY